MITLMQGSLGSGKSACMVIDLVEHLMAGGVCAANFRLVDDWAYRLADFNLWVRLGLRDRDQVAADYYSRFMVIGSPESLWEASEKLIPKAKGDVAKKFEGHGRLYFDECGIFFNARDWNKNKPFIHFFSQSRKLKWDVILIAHIVGHIDKQIRAFIEFDTYFRNLQRVRIPFLGLPLSPIPAFLAITKYSGQAAGGGVVHSRKLYPLFKRYYNLYKSDYVFSPELVPTPEYCGPSPRVGEVAGRNTQGIEQESILPIPNEPREMNPELKEFFNEIKTRWGSSCTENI